MKNVTTGLGLCVLGVGIAAYPVLDHLVPRADAGAPRGGGAIVAAATGQVEPTIVWYGVATGSSGNVCIVRAWSDGKVEAKTGRTRCNNFPDPSTYRYYWEPEGGSSCGNVWAPVSDPSQGLTYRSDINFDSKVDGADLGALLADWGDAPRRDIPPSVCPLNLINP
jgi:hypothetical protein